MREVFTTPQMSLSNLAANINFVAMAHTNPPNLVDIDCSIDFRNLKFESCHANEAYKWEEAVEESGEADALLDGGRLGGGRDDQDDLGGEEEDTGGSTCHQ